MKTTLKQLMGWMVAGAGLSPCLDAAVVSTFDTDADGWYTRDLVGLATAPPGATSSVTWDPAGFIQTTDTLDWVAFAAPAKFLGDKSAYYGGTLSFDLGATWNDGVAYPNAVLYSGGNAVAYVTSPPATVGFTSYSLPLAPGGWSWNGATVATAAQIQSVLADLDGLFVSADWFSGADDARLDNVRLAAVPEPASLAAMATLGLLGFAGGRRATRPP